MMKAYKRFAAALAAFILCMSFGLSAMASDAITEETGAAEAAAQNSGEISFEDSSWDEIMDALLIKYDTDRDHVCAAYTNLVTGEEYYLNPDLYMVAASTYKLPLNMYFTDKINSGEFDWSGTYPFSYEGVRDDSLIYSDNNQSMFLYDVLGGYNKFRELIAEYTGTAVENMDPNDILFNKFTVRELNQCLKTLYNEQERFPGMIETMQKADPDRFFKLNEPRFKIAHKYGYYSENGRVNMNDCGIAFTTQPISIVMFTQSVNDAEGLLTEYCTTMCEYTEYLANKPEPTPEPTPSPEPTPAPAMEPVEARPEEAGLPVVAIGAVLLFLAGGLALVVGMSVKHKLRAFWLIAAILLSAVIMLLAIVGMRFGTVYAKPSGDPQQTAVSFMDSLCSGNYDRAYSYLRDYADLGLEAEPETAAAQMAYNALHSSFSYELSAECSVDKLEAVQPVSFNYLDLTALESAVIEETPKQLKELVETRPMNQIYDAERNYLPQVTEEAYLKAVQAVLENAGSYYKSIELELSLSYSDGSWQVLTSPALLRALNGGAGY